MKPSIPSYTANALLSRPDRHTANSVEGPSTLLADSMPWMASASLPVPSTSAAMTLANIGQLSPISTGTCADGPASSTIAAYSHNPLNYHARQVVDDTSSLSQSTDSWSIVDQDSSDEVIVMPDAQTECYGQWPPADLDESAIEPKLEPLEEDDFRLADLQEAPLDPVPSRHEPPSAQSVPKRPRGRPRKHPLIPIVSPNKVAKGRSKTGCLTCRKRKKKCDEAKPRCLNCEKNAVVCEGYPEKQLWRSGRERPDEGSSLPSITLQPLFHGLETVEDRIFWKHYNEHLSAVLTVEGEHKNAFRNLIVTVAVKHKGLMHSVLSLSSKHVDYETPYGAKILANPATDLEALRDRSEYHSKQAMDILKRDLGSFYDGTTAECEALLPARYGQILCLFLESLVDGDSDGAHRYHLAAFKSMIKESPPSDPALLAFVTEFFQYHIFADELLRHPDNDRIPLASAAWVPPSPIPTPRLLGVADGLLSFLPQITALRDTVRSNIRGEVDPVVDYHVIYPAAEIEAGILDWAPDWPAGDSRGRANLLYKQMMWIYLAHSISPPPRSRKTYMSMVSESLTPRAQAASTDHFASSAAESPVTTPTTATTTTTTLSSAPTSCSSSPTLCYHLSAQTPSINEGPYATAAYRDEGQIRRHSVPETGFPDDAASPPPVRLPPTHDSKFSIPVQECLDILESFKSSDPCQALLLMPCLVIGTVCFAAGQRDRIRAAIKVVRGYRGLRTIDRVSELLEAVWRAMDRGDWQAVWDWQGLARHLHLDFLCA